MEERSLMTKHQFTLHEGLLPLCEVGMKPTRMQVQHFFDQQRASRGPLGDALRATEKALGIWDLRVNASGQVVFFVDEETHLQEAGFAPRGFVAYRDGKYDGFIRKEDGVGLRDLHDRGECPKDCNYCSGDQKKMKAEADGAEMKAKATSKYWKSGRKE
jgi:hypothetical protein